MLVLATARGGAVTLLSLRRYYPDQVFDKDVDHHLSTGIISAFTI